MNRYKLLLIVTVILVSCNTTGKKKAAVPVSQEAQGKMDTAQTIHDLEAAFTQRPDMQTGLSLANLYAETKNAKAIGLCDALLTKDTARELTDAVFIKGIYYTNINDTAAAMHFFNECIQRDWKFIEAYIEKGILQYNRQDYASALKTFELAVRVANTYPDAYYWLGRSYEAMGNKEQALDNYYRALSLDKDLKEAQESIKRLTP